MHPRLAELIEYDQLQREKLLACVSLVPEELRDQRVDASCWSVAEVLEHLHRVETSIVRLLTRGVERAKAAAVQPERETGSMLSSLDDYRITDRGVRMSAPDIVMPRGELSAMQALRALQESRQLLLTALRTANGVALSTICYPHAILGTLNLYQWILFVGLHEARHAEQIEDIGRRLQRGAEGG